MARCWQQMLTRSFHAAVHQFRFIKEKLWKKKKNSPPAPLTRWILKPAVSRSLLTVWRSLFDSLQSGKKRKKNACVKTTITSLYKHTGGILTMITELHKECDSFFHEADGKNTPGYGSERPTPTCQECLRSHCRLLGQHAVNTFKHSPNCSTYCKRGQRRSAWKGPVSRRSPSRLAE